MNTLADVGPIAAGSSLSHAQLIILQTWFSPSFPVGSYSYSHGLEWVVEAGHARDAAALAAWIEGILEHGAGRSDSILLGATWRAAIDDDGDRVAELAELAAAMQPSAERRLESLSQGTAFLEAVVAAGGEPLPLLRPAPPGDDAETSYPVAVAIAAAAHGLPLEAVLVAWLHAFAASLVSAGVRLIPLGQKDGLKCLARLAPVVARVAARACSAGIDEIGSASLLADIASMRHETQYTRLFRS